MRRVVLLVAVPLPMWAKRWLYNRIFGWSVDARACIRYSYIDVGHLTMGPNSYVGHGNVIRGLAGLDLAEDTYVKNFNQILAHALPNFPVRQMTVGPRTRIMSRHFFDVSGSIEIGDDCVIGGRDTQMWSHSRFTRDGVPSLEPRTLLLGDRVYVGARCTLVHCEIPDGAVVGAGAVVTKAFSGDRLVIVGNPATAREQRSA